MRNTIENELNEGPMIRRLRPSDMDAVVKLDSKIFGRRRERYFETKLKMALADTGIEVSLAAEKDEIFVGFLLARVYYGEFGIAEKVAVLDTLDVHPDFRGSGVGRALMRQLRLHLQALQINVLQTEVSWDNQDLLRFFNGQGFELAPRLCLDLDLRTPVPEPEVD
jgi:ribosomal protein S18 acetylase RimI-like enzyme